MLRIAFAALAVLAFACEVDTGEEPLPGTTGGAGGGQSSGGSGGTTGGSQGTTGGTTGGSQGTTGGTTGGSQGTTGGSGGATAGTGGATGGSAGNTGSSGKGGSAGDAGGPAVGGGAGMSAGGSASGSGGTGTAGTSGTSGCAADIRCKLDALPSTGDPAQDCVDRINQFRADCACLPPLARWTEAEACADQMAEYDSAQGEDGEAHAGFQADICEGGSAQNECPGWRSEEQVVDGCLQAMWDEGPPPTTTCNGACFQMYGHFINMTNTRYTKVACGFFTTADGEVWSVQNFTR